MATHTAINLLHPHITKSDDGLVMKAIKNNKIMFACVVFSVFAHIVFLIRFSGLENHNIVDNPISHSIDIVLNKHFDKVAPQTKKKVVPKQKKIVHKEKPKPVKQKAIAPTKTQPVTEEKIVEEVIAEEEIKEKEEIVEEVDEQLEQIVPNNTPAEPALMISEKKLYLKTIAAHLEKHKFYPRSARRRHIEGDVRVSFEVLQNGDILNLHTFTGHRVLQKATSESIQSALPLPPRPESLLALNSIPIEYTMQYTMQN